MAVLLPVFGLQAQFINPTYTEYTCNCGDVDAITIENLETTYISEDVAPSLQAIVHDGDIPSIIWVDYSGSTPVYTCHLVEAFNRNYQVNDPDIVFNYKRGQAEVMIVYESDYNGVKGIYSCSFRLKTGPVKLRF